MILCSPLATNDSPLHMKYTNCSYQLVSGSMAHKPQNQPVLRHCKMSSSLCHSFLSLEHCVILYPYTHARVLGSLLFSTGISPLSRVLNHGCTLESFGSFKKPNGWVTCPDIVDLENGLVSHFFKASQIILTR